MIDATSESPITADSAPNSMTPEALLQQLLIRCVKCDASDLHIAPGLPAFLRIHGILEPQADLGLLTPEMTADMGEVIGRGFDRAAFERTGSLDGGQRGVVAFFGVRGIGSVYYLAYGLGEAPELASDWLWSTIAFTVTASVLVHGVLRALVDVDAVAAREIAVQDDEIDRLYHATFDEVVALMRADPANVERGTRIIIASHYLERIGDRSTNIAEDIVYLVTGDVEDLNP